MTQKIGVVNVNAHWLAGFESWRVDRLVASFKKSRLDILLVQELKTYDNAQLISKKMGWGGRIVDDDKPRKGDSCVLHGGFAPVATGIIWNPKKIEAISTGQVVTYAGWHRNKWATHGRFDIEGKKSGLAVTHLEFDPRGPNTKPKFDTIRRQQTDGMLDKIKKPGQTWIVGADANCDLDDDRDGFGMGLKAHGMVDTDRSAKTNLNGDRTLVKTTWNKGYRIIRAGHTKDVKVPWQNTIRMYNWTDHNMRVFEIDIPA